MKILHLCWGLEPTNGAANIARLIIGEQKAAGHAVEFVSKPSWRQLRTADQIWCHCGWYWMFWLVALYRRMFCGRPRTSAPTKLLRMTECCYDPIRLRYHGWKKRLVGPVERWSLRQCDALVATCEAEAKWNRDYVGRKCPKAEISDIKRFFRLSAEKINAEKISAEKQRSREESPCSPRSPRLNILYLGRPHPLKGTKYLEQAVKELNHHSSPSPSPSSSPSPSPLSSPSPSPFTYSLRLVSNHHGDELERDWEWCDVLCLPTLSDNLGLVIAEALERGKIVVTTDGAPAWEDFVSPRLVYLRGYRDGSDETRVSLLVEAFKRLRDLL